MLELTAERILQRLQILASIGVEEVMLQWFEMDDTDRLRAFAESILPNM